MDIDLTTDLPRRIHLVLREGAEFGEDRIAMVEKGQEWSYCQLIDVVESTAARLSELGVRPGDRLGIVCENSVAAIVLMYAASRLDAWAVVTNGRLRPRELDSILADCGPRRVVYTHLLSSDLDAHADRGNAEVETFPGIGPIKIGPLNESAEPEPTHEDGARQAAVVIYTTGSTGRPKGVMLSHRNLMYVAGRGKRMKSVGPDDVTTCLMPISHSYGLALMQQILFAGGKLLMMPRFDMERAIELIRGGTITIFSAVPALFSRLVMHARQNAITLTPNRLRYAYTGTAPLDLPLRRNVEQLLGAVLHNGYGLTETSPSISRTRYVLGDDEMNVGPPMSGLETKIVDTEGREVPDGEKGDLLVRGPNIMLGYYRQPDLTAAVIDKDGFFNTHDIASRGPLGDLIIHGRSKELIIKSGFNVYPAEIEELINTHPCVVGSAVIGRPIEGDEEILAFVEPAPGQSVEEREILAHIRDQLAPYKVPRRVIVVDELPSAPNGKILKSKLKETAEKMSL
jgi:acyl-CoA synthetase (AMP-forming)/AMP-acid ligase II